MDELSLCEVEAICYVARQAEIGVLVDSTRNQTGDCVCLGFVFAEDMWEGGPEGGGALDRSKVDFANTGTGQVSKIFN